MDFLCRWLTRHPDVEVVLRMIKNPHDRVLKLKVKMCCDNGLCLTRLITSTEYGHMRIIFDEMYNHLISEGGST